MRHLATKIYFSGLARLFLVSMLIGECRPEDPANRVQDRRELPDLPEKKVPPPLPPPPPSKSCEDLIGARTATPDNTLARFQTNLPYIVIDTKTLPVWYLRKPRRTTAPDAREIVDSLKKKPNLFTALRMLKKMYRKDRAMLRRIFLFEGYFFEENVRIAHLMTKEITLPDLFAEPTLYRLRNNHVETLTLSKGTYVDKDGQRALLLINDRVASKPTDLYPPLHLDLDYVRGETGARRIVPVARFSDGGAFTLVFPGGEKRPALILLENNHTVVKCIGGDTATLAATLETASRFWQHHETVVAAADRIIAERPRFDEPTDEGEDVQEDGELRLAWKEAYRNRQKSFLFREVEYEVYDPKGNPVPPQVCVDFIVDTWERASGTWYTPRGKKPTRTGGDIDFYALKGMSRRYISSLLAHARTPDSPFERYDVPMRDWAPLEKRRPFVRKLLKHAGHYQEGDLLVIHGLREEDMQEHYHTVLVLRTDPITGLPTLIADNQGRPRISTLVQAMRAAPKRSVKHRLRLDVEKMKQLTTAYRQALADGTE